MHSNDVSLSTKRLGRGREWAVKKARMEAKDESHGRKTVIRMYLFPRRDSTGS
jgi:hypothetical protein